MSHRSEQVRVALSRDLHGATVFARSFKDRAIPKRESVSSSNAKQQRRFGRLTNASPRTLRIEWRPSRSRSRTYRDRLVSLGRGDHAVIRRVAVDYRLFTTLRRRRADGVTIVAVAVAVVVVLSPCSSRLVDAAATTTSASVDTAAPR